MAGSQYPQVYVVMDGELPHAQRMAASKVLSRLGIQFEESQPAGKGASGMVTRVRAAVERLQTKASGSLGNSQHTAVYAVIGNNLETAKALAQGCSQARVVGVDVLAQRPSLRDLANLQVRAAAPALRPRL
jgi:hypothetical protein